MVFVLDLQMVNMTVRVLSKPKKESLPTIFQNLGLDWDERVLPSIGTEVVKAVVAQYNAEHLITERDKVSKAVNIKSPFPCCLIPNRSAKV